MAWGWYICADIMLAPIGIIIGAAIMPMGAIMVMGFIIPMPPMPMGAIMPPIPAMLMGAIMVIGFIIPMGLVIWPMPN